MLAVLEMLLLMASVASDMTLHAGLLKAMAVAVVAYHSTREGQQKDPSWFGKLMTEPILKAAARLATPDS